MFRKANEFSKMDALNYFNFAKLEVFDVTNIFKDIPLPRFMCFTLYIKDLIVNGVRTFLARNVPPVFRND